VRRHRELSGSAAWSVRSQPGRASKKLIAWSRWIAGAGPEHDGLRLWDVDGAWPNINASYCKGCRQENGGNACADCPEPKLLPENDLAARAYLACHTQWNVGTAGRTGLRYEGCTAILGVHAGNLGIADMSETMAQIQCIEIAMLGADAERREAEEAERNARQASGGFAQ